MSLIFNFVNSDHIKECETSNEFEEAAASTRRYLAAAFVRYYYLFY